MPCRMLDIVTNESKGLSLIHNKSNRYNTKCRFVAKVKRRISNDFISEYINFLPIIRNIDITIDTDYRTMLKDSNINTLNTERKLTEPKDTANEFMAFSSYYLWYLIDRFHFLVDAVESVVTVTASAPFNSCGT